MIINDKMSFMLKTKDGEKISIGEAMKRFKDGVENITPLQKLQNEIRGNYIIFSGFFVALVAVIIGLDDIGLIAYGLILIFIGSIITTGLKILGLRQQLKFFKNMDDNSQDVSDILDKLEVEDEKAPRN